MKNKSSIKKRKKKLNLAELFINTLKYTLLIIGAVIMIGPFVWMISTSLKDVGSIFKIPPQIIPDHISFKNYVEIFRKFPFLQFTLNSFKITILSTIGLLISSSLAAYAFARMKFKGSNIIYFIVLATMMIPSQITMIPMFLIMKTLGLLDSHWAIILPAYFGFGGAFGIFLLRQFFASIPKDLEDAAKIDGCGKFKIFWHIFLPQSKPILATLTVFSFMFYWNDLLNPVIYLSSLRKMTLTVGLASIQGLNFLRYDLMMAGSFLSILPILVLFIFAQKFFIQSVIHTGIKG
jgi:multiple sugar transport system permease protein